MESGMNMRESVEGSEGSIGLVHDSLLHSLKRVSLYHTPCTVLVWGSARSAWAPAASYLGHDRERIYQRSHRCLDIQRVYHSRRLSSTLVALIDIFG